MSTVTRIVQFEATVPAGTAAANPLVTQCQLGPGTVEWVEIQVPPGPRGQMGLYVASSLQQIIPYRVGATPIWLTVDGAMLRYDLDGLPDSGDFQVVAYNTGNYPHTWWARFGVNDELGGPAPDASTAAPDLSVLNS